MGIYLNPGNEEFYRAVNSQIWQIYGSEYAYCVL